MVNVSRETRSLLAGFVLTGLALAMPSQVLAGPYVAPPGCPGEPMSLEQDLARRRPNEARYPVCVDQRALLNEAQERARREARVLLVHFGAPWCPICRVLPGELAAMRADKSDRHVAAAFDGFVEVSLSLSVIADGKRQEISEAHAILDELYARPNVERLRAIPYLVVMGPDGGRVVGRNIDDLQAVAHGGIDRIELGRSLAIARAHVLDGSPSPTSPSWLARKLRKFGF